MLLREAETETKIGSNVHSKIRQMISWEGLFTEMVQFQHEFKNFGNFFMKYKFLIYNKHIFLYCCYFVVIGDLVERCKQCFEAVQGDNNLMPRQEIAEQCVLTLLNVGEWEYLTKRHYNCFKLPIAIAYTSLDVNKFKGTKKSAKEIWDLGKSTDVFPFSVNPLCNILMELYCNLYLSSIANARLWLFYF